GAHVLLQVLSGHVIPTWRVPVCCYKKRRTKVPFMTRVFARGSGALQRARSGGVRYGIVAGQRRTPHENDRRRTASSGCPTRRPAPVVECDLGHTLTVRSAGDVRRVLLGGE